MIESECPDCGDRVFIFARYCPRCGTANVARMGGLWVAGALAMLAVAVVVAVVAVLRGHPLPIAGTPDAPVGEHVEASSASNFGWLTVAMSECETEAMKDLDTLINFGMLLRNLHRYSAHGMVIVVFLHMLRVFYTGSYRPPREFNWAIGAILLFCTFFLSFTGSPNGYARLHKIIFVVNLGICLGDNGVLFI